MKVEGRYPRGPNGECLPSYDVVTGCDVEGGEEQRKAALADLSRLQEPAPIRAIEAWLAELSVLVAGRGQDGIAAELQVTAYSSRLARYPADVARAALLGRSWKWFPSWAELEAVCERLAAPRRHMLAALSKPVEPKRDERKERTQAERDRVQRMIDEAFGVVPEDVRAEAQRRVDEAFGAVPNADEGRLT